MLAEKPGRDATPRRWRRKPNAALRSVIPRCLVCWLCFSRYFLFLSPLNGRAGSERARKTERGGLASYHRKRRARAREINLPLRVTSSPRHSPANRLTPPVPSSALLPSLATCAQLFWPDDQLWYRAEVVSLNNRARSAKVLYATGDVETLSIDEIAAEGHLNVCT